MSHPTPSPFLAPCTSPVTDSGLGEACWSAVWTVIAAPPQLSRQCAGCSQLRPFATSGKFRVNGHGRRLDVWLVYRCTVCEHTYNLEVHARAHARTLRARLPAYYRNDAELAHTIATDLEFLRASRSTLLGVDEFAVLGPAPPPGTPFPWRVEMIMAPAYGLRTDRVLARGLGWSRSRTQRALRAGDLAVEVRPPANPVA